MSVDLGTGDGRFALSRARRDTNMLVVGLDANVAGMIEASRRAPENALLVRGAVEALPPELCGLASDVTVNFPWGSLFAAMLAPRESELAAVRTLCAPGASLTVTTSIDIERDAAMLAHLDSTPFGPGHLERLCVGYRAAGFEPCALTAISLDEAKATGTSWARRLAHSPARSHWRLRFTARG